jgi:hypothetical protein
MKRNKNSRDRVFIRAKICKKTTKSFGKTAKQDQKAYNQCRAKISFTLTIASKCKKAGQIFKHQKH